MVCVGIGRFILFLRRRINTVHDFLCTRNAVSVQVTCTVVTVHKFVKACNFQGDAQIFKPNEVGVGRKGDDILVTLEQTRFEQNKQKVMTRTTLS